MLEHHLERVYRETLGTGDLTALETVQPNNPLLLFNTTEVGQGRSAIFGRRPTYLVDTKGFDLIEPKYLRLSTTMFLSARFPVISPDGRLPANITGNGEALEAIDGGYADNTGTLALLRMVEQMPIEARSRVIALSLTNTPLRWQIEGRSVPVRSHLAWITFEQIGPPDADIHSMPHLSFQTRILEKTAQGWKIVGSSDVMSRLWF